MEVMKRMGLVVTPHISWSDCLSMLSPTILKVYEGGLQNSGPKKESRSTLLDESDGELGFVASEEEPLSVVTSELLECSFSE